MWLTKTCGCDHDVGLLGCQPEEGGGREVGGTRTSVSMHIYINIYNYIYTACMSIATAGEMVFYLRLEVLSRGGTYPPCCCMYTGGCMYPCCSGV